MFLEFQSICIIASVSLLISNQQDQWGFAFLLFVVGVLSHALEAVYEHHNMAEERKLRTMHDLFTNLDFSDLKNKDYKFNDFVKDWKKEEEENEEK